MKINNQMIEKEPEVEPKEKAKRPCFGEINPFAKTRDCSSCELNYDCIMKKYCSNLHYNIKGPIDVNIKKRTNWERQGCEKK